MVSVLICGSREFNPNEQCKKYPSYTYSTLISTLINNLISKYNNKDVEVVEGDARGVDRWARSYALGNSYSLKEMKADWSKGKSAGYIRNIEMFEYIKSNPNKFIFIIWDGVSKGTLHDIKLSHKYNIPCYVFLYKEERWLTKEEYNDVIERS